jgi:hypothetical protein
MGKRKSKDRRKSKKKSKASSSEEAAYIAPHGGGQLLGDDGPNVDSVFGDKADENDDMGWALAGASEDDAPKEKKERKSKKQKHKKKAKEMTDYKWMSAEEAQNAIAIFRVYPAKAQHATEVLLLDEYARSMKAICHVAADRLVSANRKDRKISKERAQAPTPSVLFLAVMCWHRKSSDSCL